MQDRYGQLHDLITITRDIRDQKQLIELFIQSLLNGPLKNGRKRFLQALFFLFSRSRDTLNLFHSFNPGVSQPDNEKELSNLILQNIVRFKDQDQVLHTFQGLTYLIYPVTVKGRSIGFFTMIFMAQNLNISAADRSLLKDFLHFFQDEFYILHIFQLVIKDELTSLYNKRYLLDELSREFKPRKEKDRQLCLAMMDIDRFKHYNDTYGHQVGDHLLKSLASLIRSFSEDHEIMAFRYGGEEMVLIFKDRNPEFCHELLERLRQKIEDADFSTQQWFLKLRISAGLADIRSATNYSRLIEQADSALYRSKNLGRNRVTIYGIPDNDQ